MWPTLLLVASVLTTGPVETAAATFATSAPDRSAAASASLTLSAALTRAGTGNREILARSAEQRAAAARVGGAKAAYWPRLGVAYTYSHSNNPVAVFGSKLNQGVFAESDFAIDSLNRPDPFSNHQTSIGLEFQVYDGGDRSHGVTAARLGEEIAVEAERGAALQIHYAVTEAYFGIHVATSATEVLTAGIEAIEASLRRAEARYDAGLLSIADLLSMRTRREALLEEKIRAGNRVRLLEMELNRLMGEPLSSKWLLITPLDPLPSVESVDSEQLLAAANAARPELRQARAGVEMARTGLATAKSWWQPRVGLSAAGQHDGGRPFDDGNSSWMVALSVRMNLSDGLTTGRAQIAATAAEVEARQAELDQAVAGIELDVERALLERTAADEAVLVSRAAVESSAESHHITESRYDAGLADVTDLLRSQSEQLAARTRNLRALFQQRLALAGLDLATGSSRRKP